MFSRSKVRHGVKYEETERALPLNTLLTLGSNFRSL